VASGFLFDYLESYGLAAQPFAHMRITVRHDVVFVLAVYSLSAGRQVFLAGPGLQRPVLASTVPRYRNATGDPFQE